jgi:cellulose synthase (UDP-forming)
MTAFSEYVSSLAPTFFILGLALLTLPFVSRDSPTTRALLFSGSILLGWRYMCWRVTDTVQPFGFSAQCAISWGFAGLEALSMASSTISSLFMTRTLDRTAEADANHAWQGDAQKLVDVYICTYNEEQAVLERTIAAAKRLSYPHVKVYLLDDGGRDWLAKQCGSDGVGYITRPTHDHAKAGNLNHAFAQRLGEPDPPDFVLVLDADFAPHHNFVDRALSLFHDPRVAIVQTPQYFFNPDPIQHNLGLTSAYPDEQRYFFNHVEPARDAWGIAACCGTSAMIRARALAEIGGLPTESVTEDFLLTLRFAEHGWTTVYLNEPLSEGLAPEGLDEYITQRTRWALGTMQIARSIYNPFSLRHRLGFRQRVSVLDSTLYWITTFPFRLAAAVFPLFFWYCGVIAVNASVAGVIQYFIPYYAASLIAHNWASHGLTMPIVTDVSQMIGAAPISRAALSGLLTGGVRKFSVTAKGGDRSKVFVHWRLMAPFAALLGLTLGGLSLSLITDYTYAQSAGDGRVVILFWTLYNVAVLSLTMALCVERPRPPHSMREGAENADIEARGHLFPAWVLEASAERARVRGPSGLSRGDKAVLCLEGVGRVKAEVAELRNDGYVLKLLPNTDQRAALFGKLHCVAGAPGTVRGSLSGVLMGLMRSVFLAGRHE